MRGHVVAEVGHTLTWRRFLSAGDIKGPGVRPFDTGDRHRTRTRQHAKALTKSSQAALPAPSNYHITTGASTRAQAVAAASCRYRALTSHRPEIAPVNLKFRDLPISPYAPQRCFSRPAASTTPATCRRGGDFGSHLLTKHRAPAGCVLQACAWIFVQGRAWRKVPLKIGFRVKLMPSVSGHRPPARGSRVVGDEL